MTVQLEADLVIVGGGLGAVSAALSAARHGRSVVMLAPDDWLGGQLTSQAVPPDEHPWIESHGSASYRELREMIRSHYRRSYPLTATARADPYLNPGAGNVSRLCHEPRVAALVIEEILSSYIAAGRIRILRNAVVMEVRRTKRRIRDVLVRHGGEAVTVSGRLFADATEEGSFLPLAGVAHVYGAEGHADTGELHAPESADPADQQAVSWCAAVEFADGPPRIVPRPAGYERWRDLVDPRWPGPQLSWVDVLPHTNAPRERPLFLAGGPVNGVARQGRPDDLWHYRRILAAEVFAQPFAAEVTLINWPQIDYWEKPLLGVASREREEALAGARELTLSFVHWMQTEAPRHDGGRGYPELRLRGDVTGTADGLAREAYVRESRRIQAEFTVTEAHIGREMRGPGAGSAVFDDTVGIGYYRIDLHPSASGRSYVDIGCYPFQIPLGALIPRDIDNLVAAAKNIGTTHITNGAYRLHPVEWSIGEAVGALSHVMHESAAAPRDVHRDRDLLRRLQGLLATTGVDLAWPDDIRCGADEFDDTTKQGVAGERLMR